MLVNLPNGKTVDISFDDYLRIGMDDYRYLMSQNFGAEMEDPFFGSVLRYRGAVSRMVDKPQDPDEEDEEDEDDEEYLEPDYPYTEE